MKNSSLYTILAGVLLMVACQAKQELSLQAPSKHPIYSITVEDAAEVELLREQLKLNIVLVTMPDLYFESDNPEITQQLNALGYSSVTQKNPDDVYRLYAKVTGELKPEVLSEVLVVIKEKDYSIIYGTLASLKAIQKNGVTLLVPDQEIHPREIQVQVSEQSDVQRMYDMGVDIFSAVKDGAGGYTLRGSAFDYQIDSMKEMKLNVTILKSEL